MTLYYRSGQEIKRGDRVLFHGNPAEVELVACEPSDPEQDGKKCVGGVMISDPCVSGRTFIDAEELPDYEDLEFISRR